MTGKVKTFNKQKGYGFIKPENGDDIFFHYSSLIMEGFKTIDPDTEVSFYVEDTEKGPRAVNIQRV